MQTFMVLFKVPDVEFEFEHQVDFQSYLKINFSFFNEALFLTPEV